MVGEILNAIVSWETFLISLLVFGFAPGAVLRLIVLAFRRDDPRRREMLAELHRVPRLERPYWVFEQLEVALFEGIWERLLWAGAGRIYGRWHLNPGLTYDEQHSAGYPISDEDFEQAVERGMLVKLSFSTSDVWRRRNLPEEAMWVQGEAILGSGRRCEETPLRRRARQPADHHSSPQQGRRGEVQGPPHH